MTHIGVTGHRRLDDEQQVALHVGAAIQHIARVFPAPHTLHSALAEGADRLAARLAIDLLQARLVVPLPLAQADYELDFSARSRGEFRALLALAAEVVSLPPAPTRPAAYEAAGLYILDHVSVLIAVWDGKPARGRGGTAQIVAEARKRGLPLAWVGVGSAARLTYERFPGEQATFRG